MVHSLAKTGSVQERIEETAQRIVSQFQPEKITLFGSHARGEAGLDSDVDLLVVMPVEGRNAERRQKLMLHSLTEQFHLT